MVFAFSLHIRDRSGRAVPLFHRLFMALDDIENPSEPPAALDATIDDLVSASLLEGSWTPSIVEDNNSSDGGGAGTASPDTQSVRSLESDLFSFTSTLPTPMSDAEGVNLPSGVTRLIPALRSPALLAIVDEVQSHCNYSLLVGGTAQRKVASSGQQNATAQTISPESVTEGLKFGAYSSCASNRGGEVRVLWLYGFNLCFVLVCEPEENPLAAKAALKLLAQKCQEHMRLFNKPLVALYRSECLHFIVKSILGEGVIRFFNSKALKLLEKDLDRGIRLFGKI